MSYLHADAAVTLAGADVIRFTINLQYFIEALEDVGQLHLAFEAAQMQALLTDRLFGVEGEQ